MFGLMFVYLVLFIWFGLDFDFSCWCVINGWIVSECLFVIGIVCYFVRLFLWLL